MGAARPRVGARIEEFSDYGGTPAAPVSPPAELVVASRPAALEAGEGDSPPSLPALDVLQVEERDLIRRVWGPAMLDDVGKVRAIVRIRSTLREETGRMLKSAIMIGRSVVDLKEELSRPEFERAMRSSREVFPGWSKSNLSKMVSVAGFLNALDAPIEKLPQSYSVLYEFTTMKSSDLQLARETGLFAPSVTRAAVLVFKRHLDRKRLSDAIGSKPPNAAAIEEVDGRLKAILAEARELRRRRSLLAAEDMAWLASRGGAGRRRRDSASSSTRRIPGSSPLDGVEDGEGRVS